PIDHLSRAVTSISNDNLLFDIDPYLPTKNTEVGRLALTFVQLSDKLRFYYTSLDSEVKSRTKELLEKTTSLEEQVKETQKFKMAVTSSTDAIVITDADGNIVYVNKAWENLNKYSSQEALGKNPRILNSSQTPSDVFIEMWSALKGGKPYSSEQLVNKRKDGSTYEAALAVYPILSKEKTLYYVGVQHDITERKMIERAKSDFVSLASHQLRTPLSAINWYIEMLLNGDVGNLTKEQTDVASVVMDSSKRMGVLIEALLNVARIESNTFIIKPEPINIKEMLDNILLTVGVTASKKNISISFAYDFSLPTINLDKNIAEVIFTNLLTNAIKYTPNEGIVTVTVTQFPELSKNPTHVLYKVADNGYGIPESAKSNIFSKLYRANNVKNLDTDGTGLGLYTVKSVVESIGGKVWFESTEGEGSTFYVTIPLSGMQAKEGSRVLNVI
ncbi:PAS domain S-box protein, partial [candidate division WWE3 bacterium]|nr:PAS domain S-box protein [candidate division WWE3 bacterium]